MDKKRRIAIIGVGVIGIPVLENILIKLSHQFSITIYSFIPLDTHDISKVIHVRSLPRGIHMRIKYFILGVVIFWDHLRNPYAIIHAQSAFPGGVLARRMSKLLRLPWMVTLIGGETEAMPEVPFGDLLDNQLKKITKNVCVETNILTTMSAYQAECVRNSLGIHREIVVLPYAPTAPSELNKKDLEEPLNLLHISTFHPVKNHDMLLRAMRELKRKISFSLTIVGANYGQEFYEKVKHFGLEDNLKVIGEVPYAEISAFCNVAHMLIHTSWYEGLPTVAFEAMANGAVVCGTAVGILANQSLTYCLSVKPNDHEALVKCILSLTNDPELYQRLRINAHKWAKENDADHYVKNMTSLYNSLIKN